VHSVSYGATGGSSGDALLEAAAALTIATAILTITLFPVSAGLVLKPTTNGEIMSETPSMKLRFAQNA
jgi:hypothetical protein